MIKQKYFNCMLGVFMAVKKRTAYMIVVNATWLGPVGPGSFYNITESYVIVRNSINLKCF